ncbi:MAG: T9SS type A sorting domain-containing protein [Chlorobiota bacterium]|nr:MAG: T9SS type A sorting domain-containing protein [Chlorobiota bacterium]
MKKHILIITITFLLFHSKIIAQLISEEASGFKYVITFPDTAGNDRDYRFPYYNINSSSLIFVYSQVNQFISLSNKKTFTRVNLLAGKVNTIDVSNYNLQTTNPGVVSDNSITIDADFPIVVYCYINTSFGAEAWTPLPVESWGTEYYLATLHSDKTNNINPATNDEFNFGNKDFSPAPAQAIVIAAYDNTQFSIKANLTSNYKRLAPANTPLVVKLNAGETFLIESWVETSYLNRNEPIDSLVDLGGFKIESDKPVGVISGNTRSLGLDPTAISNKALALTGNSLKNLFIESLAPVNQLGKEFVYLPSMDTKNPNSGSNSGIRKKESIRVYGTSPGITIISLDNKINSQVNEGTGSDYIQKLSFNPINPHYIVTDKPSQVFMNSSAVSEKLKSSVTTWAGSSSDYNTYGGFMVESVPIEHWVSFAPFITPSFGYENYLNIVTKKINKNNLFKVVGNSRKQIPLTDIPGTDLAWGFIQLKIDESGVIEGIKDSKFYGYVYGIPLNGFCFELFSPGVTKKKDDDKNIPKLESSGSGNKVLHASEYREQIKNASYGYPLAPSRNIIGKGDSLEVQLISDCNLMRIKYKTFNQNPVGLRTIKLENPINMKLFFIDPKTVKEVINSTIGEFYVTPIDTSKYAETTILIQDRTGKIWRYFFSNGEQFIYEKFTQTKSKNGTTSIISLRNPLAYPVTIKKVYLQNGYPYTITSVTPFPPTQIPSNGILKVGLLLPKDSTHKSDFIVVEGECRKVSINIKISDIDSVSIPVLSEFPPRIEWVAGINDCTKNKKREYDTTVSVFNVGNKIMVIDTCFLFGKDADSSIFILGERPKIQKGDWVRPNDTIEFRRSQQVIFRPKEEGNYSCIFVLVTSDGDSLKVELNASAIESHISISNYDFGKFEFIGERKVSSSGDVILKSLPSRINTITDIKIIGNDSLDFEFESGFDLPTIEKPWTLKIGELKKIPLIYKPSTNGRKTAKLSVSGDHSKCDDSTNILIGESYQFKFESEVTSHSFAKIMSCKKDSSVIKLSNTGTGSIFITDYKLIDDKNVFTVEPIKLPFPLAPLESVNIKINFKSKNPGSYSGSLLFYPVKFTDSSLLPILVSELNGSSFYIKSKISSIKGVKGLPYDTVIIPLKLLDQVDDLSLNKFIITVKYEKGTLLLLNSSTNEFKSKFLNNSIIKDWNFNIIKNVPGEIIVEFTSTDNSLKGVGELLRVPFQLFAGSEPLSTVKYYLDIGEFGNCATITTDSVYVTLDSNCETLTRSVELTNSIYKLNPISPNPSNGKIKFSFSLGLDGNTNFCLLNNKGVKIKELLRNNLGIGNYSIEMNSNDLPNGIYFYRIESGVWSDTKKLIICK